jgi:purine nucleosidase
MAFFADHHRARYGWDGPPIHDAVAVAWLVEPSLVVSHRLHAAEGLAGRQPNADVGESINRERLMDLVVDAIGSYR